MAFLKALTLPHIIILLQAHFAVYRPSELKNTNDLERSIPMKRQYWLHPKSPCSCILPWLLLLFLFSIRYLCRHYSNRSFGHLDNRVHGEAIPRFGSNSLASSYLSSSSSCDSSEHMLRTLCFHGQISSWLPRTTALSTRNWVQLTNHTLHPRFSFFLLSP